MGIQLFWTLHRCVFCSEGRQDLAVSAVYSDNWSLITSWHRAEQILLTGAQATLTSTIDPNKAEHQAAIWGLISETCSYDITSAAGEQWSLGSCNGSRNEIIILICHIVSREGAFRDKINTEGCSAIMSPKQIHFKVKLGHNLSGNVSECMRETRGEEKQTAVIEKKIQ